MKFIGDIHGNWELYNQITEGTTNTIQVGDFGFGFEKHIKTKLNVDNMVKNNHQFFRGNHDDPVKCMEIPTYIEDGTFDNTGQVFCVGGAYSIDRDSRIEGINWWKDEELSIDRFYQIMDIYETEKPEIVATHDCPKDLYKFICSNHSYDAPSRTAQALSSMLYIHRPKIWVFGHHHTNFDEIIDGTRFICCPIDTIVEI